MAWWTRATNRGRVATRRGPGDERTAALAAGNADAVTRLRDGDPHEARHLLAGTVVTCRALLGADHPDTLVAEGNLAVATVAAQRAEGIDLLRTCVADRMRVFGPDDARTLAAQDALATAYRLVGRAKEAVDLAAHVAGLRRALLGPIHPDTLAARTGLGLAQAATGDVASAAAVLESALRDAAYAHGPGHLLPITIRSALAGVYAALGRTADAVAGLEQAVADAVELLGPDDPDTRALRDDLAEIHSVRPLGLIA